MRVGGGDDNFIPSSHCGGRSGLESLRPEGAEWWAEGLVGAVSRGPRPAPRPSRPLKPPVPQRTLLSEFSLHTCCKHAFYCRKNCMRYWYVSHVYGKAIKNNLLILGRGRGRKREKHPFASCVGREQDGTRSLGPRSCLAMACKALGSLSDCSCLNLAICLRHVRTSKGERNTRAHTPRTLLH